MFPICSDKALLPSITSEHSVEDISNLQLKGPAITTSSTSIPTTTKQTHTQREPQEACVDNSQPNPIKAKPPTTKPILKSRKPEPVGPYTGQYDKTRYSSGYGNQVCDLVWCWAWQSCHYCRRVICKELMVTGTQTPWIHPTTPLLTTPRWDYYFILYSKL